MSQQQAIQLFQSLPLELQKEVMDFMEFLALKRKTQAGNDSPSKRQPGIRKNLIKYMAEDFDAPLDDLQEYM